MKYILRLNPRAYNPITKRLMPERLWEVEQCASKDSEKVIWHCADVRVDAEPVRTLYAAPAPGLKPWEREFFGTCVRGQDNAIEIHTGPSDASGN